MVEVNGFDDVEDAVIDFYGVLSSSSGRASRFYSLYYLSEVEGMTKYGFDLMKESDLQKDVFYNYAIYACISELGNLGHHWKIGLDSLRDIAFSSGVLEGQGEDSLGVGDIGAADRVSMDIEKEINMKGPNGAKHIVRQLMLNDAPYWTSPLSRNSMVEMAEMAEEEYSAFTEGAKFLEAVKFIFGHDWASMYGDDRPGYIPSQITDEDIGWVSNYGGDGWENVPQTALMKHEMGDNAFVDLMWSVEHNNGNFTDKVPNTDSEEVGAVRKYIMDELDEKNLVTTGKFRYPTEKTIASEVRKTILNTILLYARDENIRPLYKIADYKWPDLFDREITEDVFPMKEYMIERRPIKNMLR